MGRRVEAYTPHMAPEHWAPIEGFVRSTVLAARPRVPYTSKALLTVLSQYVLWCYQAACVPLTAAEVFVPSLVEEWVNHGCSSTWSASSRASVRSMLRRVGEALAPDAPEARPAPIPANIGKAPYTTAEVARIRNWASAQTTIRKTRDATAVCALGLGAGLRRDEIVLLAPTDVIVDDLGVAVVVPGPSARIVPVMADWAHELAEVAEAADQDDWLVCPGRRSTDGRLVANMIRNCHPHVPRPDLQKMRSTWIVRHLAAAVPMTALVEAAGVEGLFSLARYLDHVPTLDADTIRRVLDGDGGAAS